LPENITERDLTDEFSRFGTLDNVWVARKPPGFAFIQFADGRDADDACRKLDGALTFSSPIGSGGLIGPCALCVER
jgi:RNA recognition motif-containing protein